MPQKPETRFSNKLTEFLEIHSAVVFNVHGGAMQAAGWPDLQVYHRDWVGHLELKMRNGKLTALQCLRIKKLRRVGFPAYVFRQMNDSLWQVEDHDKKVLLEVKSWKNLLTQLSNL